MAITAKWYGNALLKALGKEIDFLNDDIRLMLCTSSYVPDQDAHIYKDVHITNEVVGTGYTAGGVALVNKTLTYTGGTNVIKLDADDVAIANSTITARIGVLYDNTPASNKLLLGFIDFGEDKISSAGTFQITWDPAGFLTITAA